MRIDQIELTGSLSISSSLGTTPLRVNDNYLFVSNTGNVGIGTKTPTSKLVVTGSASISGDLSLKTLAIGSCESRPSTINTSGMCMWFDSTIKKPMVSYCEYTTLVGSWTAGGALATARQSLAGAGTQNAGLVAGGYTNAAPGVSCTEEYNGTSWSTGGALITARYALAGAGTQNEGLVAGGFTNANVSCTEEYNGTSWSVGGALIIARHALTGAGTQNAALVAGGFISAVPGVSCTEEYNGTSWSAGGALIIARHALTGAGSQAAGLVAGGYTNANVSCTEEYDKPLQIFDCCL